MKRFLCAVISVLSAVSFFAEEPTKEQMQAIFMMNYAQYVTYKLKTYNNIIALEEEYENLNNNMNFSTIQDYNSVDTINKLADSIYNERKNHKNRERLEASIEKKMNDALLNSIPQVTTIISGNLNPLTLAINTAKSAGSIFISYQQYKNKLADEYDEKMFEFQTLSEDILNILYQDLNTYTYDLVQKYKIADEWRLNKKELEEIFKYLKDTNAQRKYTNLKNMSEGRYVQHVRMFWYHLAKAAEMTGDENAALKYYDRFEKENIEIFRYDRTAVDAYKNKIAILIKNQNANKSEILAKLKFIETNKTTWNDYYFCALVYAQLGDTENANRLVERNINELSAEIDNQFLDAENLQKVYETSDFNGKNYYAGLELNRALLKNFGGNSFSIIKSIQEQSKNDTIAFNESLYYFGLQTSSSLVKNAMEEIKKIKISANVVSPKYCKIDTDIPFQWVISSSSELYACFYGKETGETLEVPMKLDEKASKKFKKSASSTKDCILSYTTGKINVDWKDKGLEFVGIMIKHSLYPVRFNYTMNFNDIVKLVNPFKSKTPEVVVFNERSYKVE